MFWPTYLLGWDAITGMYIFFFLPFSLSLAVIVEFDDFSGSFITERVSSLLPITTSMTNNYMYTLLKN